VEMKGVEKYLVVRSSVFYGKADAWIDLFLLIGLAGRSRCETWSGGLIKQETTGCMWSPVLCVWYKWCQFVWVFGQPKGKQTTFYMALTDMGFRRNTSWIMYLSCMWLRNVNWIWWPNDTKSNLMCIVDKWNSPCP
jgi:hypothetical protein